jgi:hypothetical protein
MKLDPMLTTLDAVPEEFRVNYEEVTAEDGTKSYRLAALRDFVSQDDIAGLKSALQKERTARKAAEAITVGRTAPEIEALRAELAARDADLANAAARAAAMTEIQRQAGDIEAVYALIKDRLKATKRDDGTYAIEVLGDGGGAPLLRGDGQPQGVADLVAQLKARKLNLFRGTGNSGGGSFAEDSWRGLTMAPPRNLHRFKMSVHAKAAYIREHGLPAYNALPE